MKNKFLILILVFAAFLRFYKLGDYPVSLSWDEVAIGYNAYSIAKTQSDEYGVKLPILFKSFDDYKLPGYIYLDSLIVKVFGLSPYTVRFPSALFGILAVITIYYLSKKLFNVRIALLAALFLAISPWHLQFSRAAFEANVALTIVLTGITLLLYGLKNKVAAFVSLPVLAASIYFYYSPRIFVPLAVIAFLIIFKTEIQRNFKHYLYGLVLSLLILVPITIHIFSPQGYKRVAEVSIIGDESLIVDYVDTRAKTSNIVSAVFLNRRIPLTFEVLRNYISNFSLGFLFFGEDPNPRHHSAFHGNLYIFEIPLVILGLWLLIKHKSPKTKYFILMWLLLAPLPAAFTYENPHGLRALLMLPPLVILSALGLIIFAKRNYFKAVFVVSLIFFFVNYLYSYYLVYPQRDSLAWAYGYKQMFTAVSKIQDNYDRVIVSGNFWKPYIFYLFYNKVEPSYYFFNQTQESIGKFRFGTTGWDKGGKDLDQEQIEYLKGVKTLIVITPSELEKIDHRKHFTKIITVKDYSQKKQIFEIGEWH